MVAAGKTFDISKANNTTRQVYILEQRAASAEQTSEEKHSQLADASAAAEAGREREASMKESIGTLQAELAEARGRLEEALGAVEAGRQREVSLEGKTRALESELSESRAKLVEVLSLSEAGKRRSLSLESSIEVLQTQLGQVRERLELEVAVVAELEHMLEGAQAEKRAAMEEKQGLQAEYDGLKAAMQSSIDLLQEDRDTALARATEEEAVARELARDVAEIQASMEATTAAHQEQVLELKRQLDDGEARRALLHTELNGFQAELSAAQRELAAAQVELSSMQDELSTVQEQLQGTMEDRDRVLSSLQSSEANYAECERDLQDAQEKTIELELSITALQQQVDSLSAERDQQLAQHNSQVQQIADLNNQLEDLQASLREQEARAEEASAKTLKAIEAERDRWCAVAESRQEEAEGMRLRVSAADAEVSELQTVLRDMESKMLERMMAQSVSLSEWQEAVDDIRADRDRQQALCDAQKDRLAGFERQVAGLHSNLQEQNARMQTLIQALDVAQSERQRWFTVAQQRQEELNSLTSRLIVADGEVAEMQGVLRKLEADQSSSTLEWQRSAERLKADRDQKAATCVSQSEQLAALERQNASLRIKVEEQASSTQLSAQSLQVLQAERDRWCAVAESHEGKLLAATAKHDLLQNSITDMQKAMSAQAAELQNARVRMAACDEEVCKLKEQLQNTQNELSIELEHKNEMLRASLRHEEACRRVLAELAEKQNDRSLRNENFMALEGIMRAPTTTIRPGHAEAENVTYRMTPLLLQKQHNALQSVGGLDASKALNDALTRAHVAEETVARLEKQVQGLTQARDELQHEALSLRRRTDELRQAAEDLQVVLLEADSDKLAQKQRESAMARDFSILEGIVQALRIDLDVAVEQRNMYLARARELARGLMDVSCALRTSADARATGQDVQAVCRGVEEAVKNVAGLLLRHHTDWASKASARRDAGQVLLNAQAWHQSVVQEQGPVSVVSAAMHAQREALLAQQSVIARLSDESKVTIYFFVSVCHGTLYVKVYEKNEGVHMPSTFSSLFFLVYLPAVSVFCFPWHLFFWCLKWPMTAHPSPDTMPCPV
jgi:chromosome segregation ATPase